MKQWGTNLNLKNTIVTINTSIKIRLLLLLKSKNDKKLNFFDNNKTL